MTREEAIKLVKRIKGAIVYTEEEKEALETLIPELRESEDERIRKWILEKVQEYADSGIPCSNEIQMANKTIAWIEKQKENPKSADSIPSDCVSDAKCEDKSPKHSDSDGTDIRDTPAYWKGWDDAMKQKEQKHPNGCFTCDEYKKGYEEGRRNGFTAGYNKAMKEVEQKEQKPWKVGANAYFTPEQKPEDRFEEAREKYQVEWSEEDERTIDTIVSVLGQYIDYKTVSGTGSGYATPRYSKEMDWLKSLRPVSKESLQSHWKPSEEQMEALKDAVRLFKETHFEKYHYKIESLYEQLKKL